MARLLVVSRSMALAMRIADDHDVVEYPVEALEDLAPEPDVEAVVLDLGEPHAAMQTLDRIRSGGHDTPVLIVSGYQPAWNDLASLTIERVQVVPLPITRAALLDGIDRLLGVTPFVPRVPPDPSPPPGLSRATPTGAAAPALPVRPVAGGQRWDPGSAHPTPLAPPTPSDPATTSEGPNGAPGTPGGVRRPGLARWLTPTPPRPSGAGPQGSPLDAGSATRRTTPGTPPGGDDNEGDGNLFRPVVEPQVPARSSATLPARPARPARPAPAPPPVGPADGRSQARSGLWSAPPVSPVPSRSAPAPPEPGTVPGNPAARAVPTTPAPSVSPAGGPPPTAAPPPPPAPPAPPPAANAAGRPAPAPRPAPGGGRGPGPGPPPPH